MINTEELMSAWKAGKKIECSNLNGYCWFLWKNNPDHPSFNNPYAEFRIIQDEDFVIYPRYVTTEERKLFFLGGTLKLTFDAKGFLKSAEVIK